MISEVVPSSLPSPPAPTVTDTGAGGDGIHVENGLWRVCSEWADFSSHSVDEVDECFSPVRGASAAVQDCVFEGAEKVCLVGCGDAEWREAEQGNWVVFKDCTFRRGSRRMPEVQSGMSVLLLNCVVEDWCLPSRQPTDPKKARGFGAWAHDGGTIVAVDCEFRQTLPFWRGGWRFMLSDLLGHLGNAWNESGILGILNPASWLPGPCRGLTASDGGSVRAVRCRKNRWWIRIQG